MVSFKELPLPYPKKETDKLCSDISKYLAGKMKKYPLLGFYYGQWYKDTPMAMIMEHKIKEAHEEAIKIAGSYYNGASGNDEREI